MHVSENSMWWILRKLFWKLNAALVDAIQSSNTWWYCLLPGILCQYSTTSSLVLISRGWCIRCPCGHTHAHDQIREEKSRESFVHPQWSRRRNFRQAAAAAALPPCGRRSGFWTDKNMVRKRCRLFLLKLPPARVRCQPRSCSLFPLWLMLLLPFCL